MVKTIKIILTEEQFNNLNIFLGRTNLIGKEAKDFVDLSRTLEIQAFEYNKREMKEIVKEEKKEPEEKK